MVASPNGATVAMHAPARPLPFHSWLNERQSLSIWLPPLPANASIINRAPILVQVLPYTSIASSRTRSNPPSGTRI